MVNFMRADVKEVFFKRGPLEIHYQLSIRSVRFYISAPREKLSGYIICPRRLKSRCDNQTDCLLSLSYCARTTDIIVYWYPGKVYSNVGLLLLCPSHGAFPIRHPNGTRKQSSTKKPLTCHLITFP